MIFFSFIQATMIQFVYFVKAQRMTPTMTKTDKITDTVILYLLLLYLFRRAPK